MDKVSEDAKLSLEAQTALTFVNGALDRAEADLAKVSDPKTTPEEKALLVSQYINVLRKDTQLSWQDAPKGIVMALTNTVPTAPGMQEWYTREERLQRAWLDFMGTVKDSQSPGVQSFINTVRERFANIDQLRTEGEIGNYSRIC